MGRGQNPWDTAKRRAGRRTGLSETLGSTSKKAPEGQRNRFQRRAKDDILQYGGPQKRACCPWVLFLPLLFGY